MRYSPAAVKFLLASYFPFLHQGKWPPEPTPDGYESEGYIPGGDKSHHAPHEEASAIAGELMLKLKEQGRVGMAIFQIYALNQSIQSIAHLMGWTEKGLRDQMRGAFKRIWRSANPEKISCPICGQFVDALHECPL